MKSIIITMLLGTMAIAVEPETTCRPDVDPHGCRELPEEVTIDGPQRPGPQ